MTRNEAEESDEEEEEGADEDEEEDEDEVGELADVNKPKPSKNKASKGSKGKKISGVGVVAGGGEEGEEGEEEGAHSLVPVPGYSIDALTGTTEEFTVEFLTHRIYIQNELGSASKVEPDKKEKNAEKVMDDIEKRRGVKLLRLVKRVSGHLLTLIVFEIPDESKDPRLMRLLQDQQYAASLEKQKVGLNNRHNLILSNPVPNPPILSSPLLQPTHPQPSHRNPPYQGDDASESNTADASGTLYPSTHPLNPPNQPFPPL